MNVTPADNAWGGRHDRGVEQSAAVRRDSVRRDEDAHVYGWHHQTRSSANGEAVIGSVQGPRSFHTVLGNDGAGTAGPRRTSVQVVFLYRAGGDQLQMPPDDGRIEVDFVEWLTRAV